MKKDATARLGFHESALQTADDDSSPMSQKHVEQSKLEMTIIKSIITYHEVNRKKFSFNYHVFLLSVPRSQPKIELEMGCAFQCRHQQDHHHQQASAKESLQHACYLNHSPSNPVATLSPRTPLTHGLSKLNPKDSSTNVKLSSPATNRKFDHQHGTTLSPANTQLEKPAIPTQHHIKETTTLDRWLQTSLGSVIQRPPWIEADTSSSSASWSPTAGFKRETTLSLGKSEHFNNKPSSD